MKIIDKNKDFYDYLQDVYKDDRYTFDRRDSYVVSRHEILSFLPPPRGMNYYKYYSENKEPEIGIILLQVWLEIYVKRVNLKK